VCHYTRTLMSVCIAAWIGPLLSQVEDARLFVWLPVSMVPSDNFDGDLSLNVGHESFRDVSQSSNYQHKGYCTCTCHVILCRSWDSCGLYLGVTPCDGNNNNNLNMIIYIHLLSHQHTVP
jgi:hypothetical protein